MKIKASYQLILASRLSIIWRVLCSLGGQSETVGMSLLKGIRSQDDASAGDVPQVL